MAAIGRQIKDGLNAAVTDGFRQLFAGGGANLIASQMAAAMSGAMKTALGNGMAGAFMGAGSSSQMMRAADVAAQMFVRRFNRQVTAGNLRFPTPTTPTAAAAGGFRPAGYAGPAAATVTGANAPQPMAVAAAAAAMAGQMRNTGQTRVVSKPSGARTVTTYQVDDAGNQRQVVRRFDRQGNMKDGPVTRTTPPTAEKSLQAQRLEQEFYQRLNRAGQALEARGFMPRETRTLDASRGMGGKIETIFTNAIGEAYRVVADREAARNRGGRAVRASVIPGGFEADADRQKRDFDRFMLDKQLGDAKAKEIDARNKEANQLFRQQRNREMQAQYDKLYAERVRPTLDFRDQRSAVRDSLAERGAQRFGTRQVTRDQGPGQRAWQDLFRDVEGRVWRRVTDQVSKTVRLSEINPLTSGGVVDRAADTSLRRELAEARRQSRRDERDMVDASRAEVQARRDAERAMIRPMLERQVAEMTSMRQGITSRPFRVDRVQQDAQGNVMRQELVRPASFFRREMRATVDYNAPSMQRAFTQQVVEGTSAWNRLTRRITGDGPLLMRVLRTAFSPIVGAARGMGNLIGGFGRFAIYAAASIYAVQRVGRAIDDLIVRPIRAIIDRTDQSREFRAAIQTVAGGQGAARQIDRELFIRTQNEAVSVEQARQAASQMAINPALAERLLTDTPGEAAANIVDFGRLVSKLGLIDPEQARNGGVQIAIREGLAGSLRSTQMRLEISPTALASSIGAQRQDLSRDPQLFLKALEKYADTYIGDEALEEVQGLYSNRRQKLRDQMDRLMIEIGESGLYDAVVDRLNDMIGDVADFIDKDPAFDVIVDSISSSLERIIGNAGEAVRSFFRELFDIPAQESTVSGVAREGSLLLDRVARLTDLLPAFASRAADAVSIFLGLFEKLSNAAMNLAGIESGDLEDRISDAIANGVADGVNRAIFGQDSPAPGSFQRFDAARNNLPSASRRAAARLASVLPAAEGMDTTGWRQQIYAAINGGNGGAGLVLQREANGLYRDRIDGVSGQLRLAGRVEDRDLGLTLTRDAMSRTGVPFATADEAARSGRSAGLADPATVAAIQSVLAGGDAVRWSDVDDLFARAAISNRAPGDLGIDIEDDLRRRLLAGDDAAQAAMRLRQRMLLDAQGNLANRPNAEMAAMLGRNLPPMPPALDADGGVNLDQYARNAERLARALRDLDLDAAADAVERVARQPLNAPSAANSAADADLASTALRRYREGRTLYPFEARLGNLRKGLQAASGLGVPMEPDPLDAYFNAIRGALPGLSGEGGTFGEHARAGLAESRRSVEASFAAAINSYGGRDQVPPDVLAGLVEARASDLASIERQMRQLDGVTADLVSAVRGVFVGLSERLTEAGPELAVEMRREMFGGSLAFAREVARRSGRSLDEVSVGFADLTPAEQSRFAEGYLGDVERLQQLRREQGIAAGMSEEAASAEAAREAARLLREALPQIRAAADAQRVRQEAFDPQARVPGLGSIGLRSLGVEDATKQEEFRLTNAAYDSLIGRFQRAAGGADREAMEGDLAVAERRGGAALISAIEARLGQEGVPDAQRAQLQEQLGAARQDEVARVVRRMQPIVETPESRRMTAAMEVSELRKLTTRLDADFERAKLAGPASSGEARQLERQLEEAQVALREATGNLHQASVAVIDNLPVSMRLGARRATVGDESVPLRVRIGQVGVMRDDAAAAAAFELDRRRGRSLGNEMGDRIFPAIGQRRAAGRQLQMYRASVMPAAQARLDEAVAGGDPADIAAAQETVAAIRAEMQGLRVDSSVALASMIELGQAGAAAMQDGLGEAIHGLLTGISSLEDALLNLADSLVRSFSNIAAESIMQQLLGAAVSGGGGLFGLGGGSGGGAGGVSTRTALGGIGNLDFAGADGGIIDGHFNPIGTVPASAGAGAIPLHALRPFADGGVVSRPTAGLIGEAGAEAIIPLRGGRVPVQLSGGQQQVAPNQSVEVIVVSDMDQAVERKLMSRAGRKMIVSAVSGKVANDGDFRQSLK